MSYLPNIILSINTSPGRSLDSGFMISSEKDAIVSYEVDVQVVSALIGTNSGTINLQTSPDNSTWTTIKSQILEGQGVVLTQKNTMPFVALIPRNTYLRLNTVSSGTNGATFAFRTQREVILNSQQ